MLVLFVIAIGFISICIILALSNLHDHITEEFFRLHRHLIEIQKLNELTERKTRKETQEIKTRLTQTRKDLNTIEKLIRKNQIPKYTVTSRS